MSFMPKACARLVTSRPILPSPTVPKTLPYNSTPIKSSRCQSRFLSEMPAGTMLRAKANNSAMVCSAAAIVFPSGVLRTNIPFRVAASTSMLSTPTPARPITLSCFAASITSAVTLVPLLISRAS